mmetsp:Transcript_22291/g.61783  ORF Transcript_22291/g.61783 Transcript_22291/m.61783 type:complete len:227 (+) Transcript_22291:39-719(+)
MSRSAFSFARVAKDFFSDSMAEPCVSIDMRRPCSCSMRPWAAASSCALLSAESPSCLSTKARRSATVAWPPNILVWFPFSASNSLACLSADSPTAFSRPARRACTEAWCCSLNSLSCATRACRDACVDFDSLTCLVCWLLRSASSLVCLSAESPMSFSKKLTRSAIEEWWCSCSARSPANCACALFSSPWLDSKAATRPWSCSSLICASLRPCECFSAESPRTFSK